MNDHFSACGQWPKNLSNFRRVGTKLIKTIILVVGPRAELRFVDVWTGNLLKKAVPLWNTFLPSSTYRRPINDVLLDLFKLLQFLQFHCHFQQPNRKVVRCVNLKFVCEYLYLIFTWWFFWNWKKLFLFQIENRTSLKKKLFLSGILTLKNSFIDSGQILNSSGTWSQKMPLS